MLLISHEQDDDEQVPGQVRSLDFTGRDDVVAMLDGVSKALDRFSSHEAERAARIGLMAGLSAELMTEIARGRQAYCARHGYAFHDADGVCAGCHATSNIVATWDESQTRPPK